MVEFQQFNGVYLSVSLVLMRAERETGKGIINSSLLLFEALLSLKSLIVHSETKARSRNTNLLDLKFHEINSLYN